MRTSLSITLSFLVLAIVVASPLAAQGNSQYTPGERARDLVVWISGPDVAGAGVVYAYDGRYAHIMTALHVARSAGQYRSDLTVEFRVWSGQSLPIETESLLGRAQLDFAAFKVDLDPLGIPPAQIERTLPLDLLGSSRSLSPGDRVFTVGHTFAYQWLIPNQPIFFHSFTDMTPGAPEPEILQVEYQCPPGHSGGALFDENWRLIGLVLNTEGPFCWALRVERALAVLREFGRSVGLRQGANESTPSAEGFLPAEIKVAVIGFDDRSSQNLRALAPAAHDVISSFLVSLPRVVVVTRDRIRTLIDEQGLVGTEKSASQLSRAGKLLDVDAVLTGSVVHYEVKRQKFKGFGTEAESHEYRMGVNLLLIDVETGRIRFSQVFETSDIKNYPQAELAPRSFLSRESELLQVILGQARAKVQNALMELALNQDDAGELVRVPIVTVPEGADVLIGGVWVGSTPTEVELSIGLHSLEISKPGYHLWKREVKVVPGTRIEINLTKR